MAIQNNMNELLDLLNDSKTELNINTELEKEIRINGGTILYSFDNIIIASEVDDKLYDDLEKDDNIDFIADLPLKKYGDVDITLINQVFDFGLSGNTSYGNVADKTEGIAPTIKNTLFTLSALTNDEFNYFITSEGTQPIRYEFYPPTNYDGEIYLNGSDIISGISEDIGVFNIKFRAINNYGFDEKTLKLTINEKVEITNTNLTVYNKLGSFFQYSIDTIGPPPKTYGIIPELPSGVFLDNNIINGIFGTGGTYEYDISVSGITTSDSKKLTITVGVVPIITSSNKIIEEQNKPIVYTVTSNLNDDEVTYSIIGILPLGLSFNGKKIEGVGMRPGSYSVIVNAVNQFGYNQMTLKIVIYDTVDTLPTTTILPTTTVEP